MSRTEFIEEFAKLVDSGQITDTETHMYKTRKSRGKATVDLNDPNVYTKVRIGKHNFFISNSDERTN